LQHDGTVKLLDFGIDRARDEAGITQHGMLVGTVLYMSHEQVRGEDLDFRSDIFSLGAVLYHVTTGALPFPGVSVAALSW
jgi:serine/threonine protein kinase